MARFYYDNYVSILLLTLAAAAYYPLNPIFVAFLTASELGRLYGYIMQRSRFRPEGSVAEYLVFLARVTFPAASAVLGGLAGANLLDVRAVASGAVGGLLFYFLSQFSSINDVAYRAGLLNERIVSWNWLAPQSD